MTTRILFLLFFLTWPQAGFADGVAVCSCIWEVGSDQIRLELIGPEANSWPQSLAISQGQGDDQVGLGTWDLLSPKITDGAVRWEVDEEPGLRVTIRPGDEEIVATFSGLKLEGEVLEPLTLTCDGRGPAVLCPAALAGCDGQGVVCHGGVTRCVGLSEVEGHLGHGDVICPCQE